MNKGSFEDFCLELAKLIGTYTSTQRGQLYLCHILDARNMGYPYYIIRRQMIRAFGRHAFKRNRARLFGLISEIECRNSWSFGTLAADYYETEHRDSARMRWLRDLARGEQPL